MPYYTIYIRSMLREESKEYLDRESYYLDIHILEKDIFQLLFEKKKTKSLEAN